MIINLEITDEDGKKLDLIAEQETRTRRGQATKMLSDAIRVKSEERENEKEDS
tara:strand:+ start:464 stop:622 length:159 start_codon:yes stop_codon:yes gene_type:complete